MGFSMGLMMILACLSLAALSLKSPEGGFTLFYMLGRGAAAPYGEGRWLILTLTLLPLIRIAALTLTEGFASVRVPVPALAGFGCLAMLALASHKDWPIWQAIEPGTFPAAITAGVLCGKGLASVIARRGLSPWRRRAAEISGVCAGLIVAVAAQVDPALTRFVLPQNQPLETYVAALVVTSVVGLVWPASAKSPGMGGRLWTDALSRK